MGIELEEPRSRACILPARSLGNVAVDAGFHSATVRWNRGWELPDYGKVAQKMLDTQEGQLSVSWELSPKGLNRGRAWLLHQFREAHRAHGVEGGPEARRPGRGLLSSPRRGSLGAPGEAGAMAMGRVCLGGSPRACKEMLSLM